MRQGVENERINRHLFLSQSGTIHWSGSQSHLWTCTKTGGSWFFDQDQMRLYALLRTLDIWLLSARLHVERQKTALFYSKRLCHSFWALERASEFLVAGRRNLIHGFSGICLIDFLSTFRYKHRRSVKEGVPFEDWVEIRWYLRICRRINRRGWICCSSMPCACGWV